MNSKTKKEGIVLKVFIGSSREQLNMAEQVAEWLEEWGCESILWADPEAFPVGAYTFETLNRISSEVDAAVFIFGGDDRTWYREHSVQAVRDNVLIEYGLFCGKLSRQKVVFVCNDDPMIPTDLLGITYINIEQRRYAKRRLNNWISGIWQGIDLPPKGEFRIMNLYEAFQTVLSEGRVWNNFRVFAISTYKTVQMLRLVADLKIRHADVLLREFVSGDPFFEESMQMAIDNAVVSWREMVKKHNVSELSLNFFDYHPDDGFYIFDDRYLISGHLNYDATSHQYEFANDVILVESSTEAGKKYIQSQIERFENIYANYRSKEEQFS